jgi:hypothetical protein
MAKKKGKEGSGEVTEAGATHPRASASIRVWKARGALGGFAVTGGASLLNGAVVFDAGMRALAGGVAGYLAAWFVAVTAWRHLVRAEARTAVRRAMEVRRRPDAEVSP